MPPTILHRFWSFIEETQTAPLLNLDDATLVGWLTRQFQRQLGLNPEETRDLSTYISGRLPLIRELAAERRFVYP
ncbi:MAG TPA: hypothetical protein V6D19_02100 [Stenomitos sp.]